MTPFLARGFEEPEAADDRDVAFVWRDHVGALTQCKDGGALAAGAERSPVREWGEFLGVFFECLAARLRRGGGGDASEQELTVLVEFESGARGTERFGVGGGAAANGAEQGG